MKSLFVVLAVLTTTLGCGKNTNPPEKIAEFKKAVDAYCACVKEQLDKPLAEIQRQACDAASDAWNEVSKSMPVASGLDPASDAIVQQWTTCRRSLSDVGM